MVQRKAANKFGIQPGSKNHVKSEKRSVALKTSSQYQDTRSKGGGDLKKRMKAARSFKALDLENLESPLRQEYLRFEKPRIDPSSTATPQKKPSPINTPDRSPNYMKPTSSSDARKERFQVSPNYSQRADNVQSRRNSNYSKSSTSGLKTMKMLTKSSSLKPVRSSMKKSSGVALYPKINVNRATCSSTLKDSKFPNSVTLHPGGNESEGTSVMKVCPYTYCSLNGHHHAPLPPLKRFLSARRRLLRTQKSMKLKGLSPVRIKCSGKSEKEIDTGQMAFSGDHAILKLDPAGSAVSPLIEVGTDFFIEIYVKSREETAESVNYDNNISIHCGGEEPKFEFSVNSEIFYEVSSIGDDELLHGSSDGTDKEMEDDRVSETQLDDPYTKLCFEDNLQKSSDFPVAEIDVSLTSPECDNCDPLCFKQADQAEAGSECCIESESHDDSEIGAEIGLDQSASEAIDMDWEEQVDVVPYPDHATECSMFSDDGSDYTTAFLPWSEDLGLHDELVSVPDDTASVSTYEEGLGNAEMLPEMSGEDTITLFAAFGSGNSEGNDAGSGNGDQSSEIDESGNSSNASNGLIQNQLMEVLDLNSKHLEPESSDEYDQKNIESVLSSIPSTSSAAIEEQIEASEENGNPDDNFLQGHNLLSDNNEDNLDKHICTPNVRDQSSEIDDSGNSSEEMLDVSKDQIQNQLMEIFYLNPKQIEPEPSDEYVQNSTESIYSSDPSGSSAAFEELIEASEENGNSKEDDFFQGHHNLLRDDNEDNLDDQICTPNLPYQTIMDEQEGESLQVEMEMVQDGIMEEQVSGQKQYDIDEEVSTQRNELEDVSSVFDSQKSIGPETDTDLVTNDNSPEHALPRAGVEDGGEMKEQIEHANGLLKIQTSDQDIAKIDQNPGQLKMDIEACLNDIITKDEKCHKDALVESNSDELDQCLYPETNNYSLDDQSDNGNVVENWEWSENDQSKLGNHTKRKEPSSAEECIGSNDEMQIEDDSMLEAAETSLPADIKRPEEDKAIISTGNESEQSLRETCSNKRERTIIRRDQTVEHMEQVRDFNPQAPRYLLIESDPEAEKVDLRHQEMDERKSSEEWMLDYALQQAVTKLSPARKRRVSLLVEAFETVMPLPKYETHLRRATFTHARPIQACS